MKKAWKIGIIAVCTALAAAAGALTVKVINPPKLYINEVCGGNDGKNAAKVTDKKGDTCDWIELYNPTDKTVSSWGLKLSVNGKEQSVEGNVKIKPKGYAIVYCSKAGFDNENVLSVKLNISKNDKDKISLKYCYSEIGSVTLPTMSEGNTYSRNEKGKYYISMPTPEKKNSTVVVGNTPEFSKKGGSYEKDFELAINVENGQKIYYTTDGSDPAKSDTKKEYTAPIKIYNRSSEKNVLSAYDPMKIQLAYKEKDVSAPADSDVDKGTVIRAVATGTKGKYGKTVTATYFVGVSSKQHNDLPIISISTAEENLYDESIGIYCLGDVYGKYKGGYSTENNFGLVPANYNQTGRNWERECYVEYIDTNGKVQLSQDAGLKIQGGWSRADYQKSFRLYARSEYGKKTFEFPFWSEAKDSEGKTIDSVKTFILRNGGNDAHYTKFKDTMLQTMVSENENLTTQSGTPCVVYIDGEYWGLYTITQDISAEYFSDKYDVNKSDVGIYKNDELDEGTTADTTSFNEMQKFISTNDMSKPENYAKACSMIDMDNFIEYAGMEAYIFNTDWPQNNYGCWRTRSIDQSNKYADGRWRFFLFDTESSCDHYNKTYETFSIFNYIRNMRGSSVLGSVLKSLLDNQTFKNKFVTALMDMKNMYFTESNYKANLSAYKKLYLGEMEATFKRFPTWANLQTATKPMLERWDEFISKRGEYIDKAVSEEYSGNKKLYTLTVKSSDYKSGTVVVNGQNMDKKFSGKYFDGNLITLKANAKSGKTFKRWKGLSGEESTKSTVTVTISKALTLTAEFNA